MAPLRVLVVDHHVAFADGLAALLSAADDLQLVGVASDASSAVAAAVRLRPDVVTVDVGDTADTAVVAEIHAAAPRAAIAVLGSIGGPQRAISAIRGGATAWVSKEDSAATLFDVLRGAAAGESYFPPAILGDVLRVLVADYDPRQARHGRLAPLTPREHDVLLCLVEGLDRRTCAKRLHMSVNTVRTHVQNLFSKLEVHTTLEAVAVALAEGVRAPSRH